MKKRKYYKGLLIYISILAFVGVVFLGILWDFLRNYQVSMPTSVMNDIVELLENTKDGSELEKITSANSNEFESQDKINDFYLSLKDKESLSYSNISEDSSDQEKAYYISSGDEQILRVVLELKKDGARYGFDKWKLKELKSVESEVCIIAPSGVEVYINGKEVSSNYITSSEKQIPLIENLYNKNWVSDLPNLIEYKVTEFVSIPVVTVKENSEEITLSKNTEGVYEYQFSATEEFAQSISPRIIEASETYGKYITKDIDFGTLSQYLISGSKLYENLRTLEIRWYQEHESYEFNNQEISDFKMYGENCFSCNVYFEQTVYTAGVPNLYKTDLTWMFVKINENWYLADMNINVAQ